MKKLALFLVSSIVEKPKKVLIEEIKDQGFLQLKLRVDPKDIKTVIGKQGKTIKSIRHLLRIKAARQGLRFHLTVEERPL